MTGIFDEMKCQNIVDIVKQLSQLYTEEHQNNNYNGVEGHKELLVQCKYRKITFNLAQIATKDFIVVNVTI